MVSSDPQLPTSDLESSLAERLQLFFGASDPAQARIYAQFELPESLIADQADLRLSGRLIGPDCEFAHTLPARIPIVHRDASHARLLAEAIVPDPCFWNPELPFLYRAEIQLRRGDSLLASWQRTLGIRRFGPRGRFLLFDGKRFVLRGIFGDLTAASTSPEAGIGDQADFLRQTWTALVVANPSPQLCQFASRRGILLVCDLRATAAKDGASGIKLIQQFVQSPAVAIAILPNDQSVPPNRNDFRNLLLAQFISATDSTVIAPWADLLFVEAADPSRSAEQFVNCNLPIIVVRRATDSSSPEQSRGACDQLQSELASFGDFAGYIT